MKNDYKKPEFLLCEIPIKDGSFNDDRFWVYHLNSLSLIEFIYLNDFSDFEFEGEKELFSYEDENYLGVFTQNNCKITSNNSEDVLKKSWLFLKHYFDWEDKNLKINNK